MADKFRVFMFHPDGTSTEETLQPVEAAEAVNKAMRLTNSFPARCGSIKRVIITDSEDVAVFEWIYGKGVVFPPKPE